MNSYTQNRNIYPQSVTDAKRMINNYVPKFVHTNSNKKKSKNQQQENKSEEQTEKEEHLFLQQQDENWQYCGWCKKKHPAKFDDCVQIKDSGSTQATANTTRNKCEQEDQTKQQSEGSEKGVNFFMQAIQEDYETDKDEYGIWYCLYTGFRRGRLQGNQQQDGQSFQTGPSNDSRFMASMGRLLHY